MLSIIISSYQPQFYSALEKNIVETIGIPYEIIKIDNPNLMGICEAYNKGASLSKYDYLLFVHEDVIFHTKEWGQKLINHLKLENVGVVGVAGSNYVPQAPIGWHLPDNSFNFLNLIQNNKTKTNPRLFKNIDSPQNVFALDGVFLGVKKVIYLKFGFDENLKGFHGYDLDFSLRIAQKYQNVVINDILIEHFSIGNPDLEWFNSNVYTREKINYHYNQSCKEVEKLVFLSFMKDTFKYFGFSFKSFFKLLKFYNQKWNIISFFYFLKLYLFFVKNKEKQI